MSWSITYFHYLLIFWITIFIFYFLGISLIAFLRKAFSVFPKMESPALHLFICIAIGITVLVTLCSLLVTRGKTVNVLLIYLIILFLFSLKTTNQNKDDKALDLIAFSKLHRKILFEFFVYGTAIYSLFALVIIHGPDWSSILHASHLIDWGLYSVNVQTILQSGQENTYNVHNLVDPDYHGMTPYHYFELWMGVILTRLQSNALTMYLFSLIVYPILCVFALAAGWMWLEESGNSKRFHRLLAFLCLFTSGWFFLNSKFIHGDGFLRLLVTSFDDLNAFLVYVPKRAVVFSFLLGVLLLLKNSKVRPAFILLLALPVFSVDSIGVVFGGSALFFVFALRKKFIGFRDALFVFISYAIFAALFYLIYTAWGNHKISLYSPADVIRQILGLSGGQIAIPFLFAARALIAAAALFSFHSLVLFLVIRNQNVEGLPKQQVDRLRLIVLLLMFMLMAGVAGWALLFSYIDAIQFFSGFLTAFQTFLLILCIPLVWVSKRLFPRVLFSVYLFFTAGYNFYATYFPLNAKLPYSKEYLDQINQYKPASKVGVSLQAKEDFEQNWAQRHVITHSLGDAYFIFMPQYLKPVEIGVFDVPETPFRQRPKTIPFLNLSIDFDAVDAHRNRIMKESSIFYRYFYKLKKGNPNISLQEAQIQFIESYKFDWAIISRNISLSESLRSRVERMITDKVSGEHFLILKQTRSNKSHHD